MRVLLTWELGLNLGHLTRLLPVAQQLRSEGYVVLMAVRDIQAATIVLGPARIPFIQAPHLPKGISLTHRATGYADILLSQGWNDRSALWGLTQGWLNIFQLFKPDHLILDYSPTVSLAARIAKIPTLLVGNGFELPPLTDPLPPFPGFSWATPERAAQAEKVAVANANIVVRAFKGKPLAALRDLVIEEKRLFTTYPELDHYGKREDEAYIGPLLGSLNAPQIDWPQGEGPKIFVCVRPDTSQVNEILGALAAIMARVICVASGFDPIQLQTFRRPHIYYSLGPVDLRNLLDCALCVTYGAEGTMLRFLMAGVPQMISPWHVEAFMSARSVNAGGLGCSIATPATTQMILEAIGCVMAATHVRDNARAFAVRAAAGAVNPSRSVVAQIVHKVAAPERPRDPLRHSVCGDAYSSGRR